MSKSKQVSVIIITAIIILVSWIMIDYEKHIVSYVSIADIHANPSAYINKDIRVPGFLSQGMFSDDKLSFTFYIKETKDQVDGIKVVHNHAPELATTSEGSPIIVIGKFVDNQINASQVLTKCSSKYEEENTSY